MGINLKDGVTVSDNYYDIDNINISVSISYLDTFTVGTVKVMYKAEEPSGNITFKERTYEVKPATANNHPVLTIQGEKPRTIEVNSVFVQNEATAYDVEDGDISHKITVTSDVDPSTLGDYNVTYKVRDIEGLEVTSIVMVRVVDTTKPTINFSSESVDVQIGSSIDLKEGVTLSDNYSNEEDIQLTMNPENLITTTAGAFIIEFTATDTSGNSTKKERTYNVVEHIVPPVDIDSTKPVLSSTGNLNLEINVGEEVIYPTVTATDETDGSLTPNRTGTIDNTKAGTYTVIYTATDNAGNVSDKIIFTVKVKAAEITPPSQTDTTKPVITISGNNSAKITMGNSFILPVVTATDNIDGDITNKIVKTGTFDINKEGVYTISYSVTDASNNKSSVDFILTVVKPVSSGGGGGGGGSYTPATKPNTPVTPVIEPVKPVETEKEAEPAASPKITIDMNNRIINIEGLGVIEIDAKPFIDKESRTMVPVRFISDAMKLTTSWDKVLKVATFTNGEIEIKVTIGSNLIYVNGKEIKMDTIAVIKDGRTFIPLRYMSNALNIDLKWNKETKMIEMN